MMRYCLEAKVDYIGPSDVSFIICYIIKVVVKKLSLTRILSTKELAGSFYDIKFL